MTFMAWRVAAASEAQAAHASFAARIQDPRGRIEQRPDATGPGGTLSSRALLIAGLTGTFSLMLLLLVQVIRRERAEAEAREGHSRFRAALEALHEGLILFDPQGHAVFANPQAASILGLQPTLLGPWLQPPDGWEVMGEDGQPFPPGEHPIRAVIEAGAPLRHAPLGLRRPGGPVRWLHLNAVAVQGSGVAAAATLTDITEARGTRQALETSQRHFARVFHLTPDGILINRLSDGVYLDFNDGFTRSMGWTREELKGRSTLDPERSIWVRQSDRDKMVAALKATGEFQGLDLEFKRKDGSILQCQMSARVIELDGVPYVLSVTRDVTAQVEEGRERRRLEAEVNHLQRLEAIGRLVSGLSHDMNNILGAILSLGTVLQEKYGSGPDLRRTSDLIVQASVRGRNLVKSLRDFSRRELVGGAELDLNALVRTEADLLERTTLKKVEVHLDLEEGLPPIRGEASAISTALVDLSMPGMDGAQVIECLTRLRPGLRVVLCTGYVDDRVPRILAHHPWVRLLTKPFTLGELESALA